MAIQLNLNQSTYGIPFLGAYFRIVSVVVSRTQVSEIKHEATLDIAGYATKPLTVDTNEIEFRRYSVPLEEIEAQIGESFLSKCYSWAMQQPDMAGSIGV